jgi:feruloyl esterase
MIGSIAFMLLSAAATAAPCESLTTLKLDKATITSAQMVPEGPAPARATGGGRAGTAAGGQAARGNAAAPAPPQQPPAMIPAHCRVQLVLKPSSDSLINMEMWLPSAERWNGKFMGVGNGGFAGSIQGRTNEMPQALRLGYATAGTDTGHQDPGGEWAIGHPEKMIDFGYRATHEMTVTGKALTQAMYGVAPNTPNVCV